MSPRPLSGTNGCRAAAGSCRPAEAGSAPLHRTEDSHRAAEKQPPPRRRWLRRLTALCCGFGLLAAGELILIAVDYDGPTEMFVGAPDGLGGTDYVSNAGAFRRTFASIPALRAIGRYPSVPPQRFPAAKPRGTCRIVVLGGSSVMGFPFRRNGSFPRFLQAMLEAVCPGTRFEVVNAGVPALNSFGVLERAWEACGYGADVIVCYTAHNEFYGAYGSASVLPLSSCRPVALAEMWLRRRRLSMAMADLIAPLLPAPSAEEARRHLAQIMPRLTDVRYEGNVYRRTRSSFAANLRAIALRARRSGAQVVLCTVACNLRDLPPIGSRHKAGWGGRQEQRWQGLVDAAEALAAAGDREAAAADLTAAVRLDPGHAGTRFRLARVLDAMDRREDARREYESARDRDTVRWRASADFNAAVRSLVTELHDPGVVLADCESHLFAVAPRAAPGQELFLDHVHPTGRGNAAVAEAIAHAIAGSSYGQRLGEWDWTRHKSPGGYARESGVDALELVLAYQQAAILWREVIGETDPPTHQYERCLAEVASLEQDLDPVQRRALSRAAEGPSADLYERLQLMLALGYMRAGRPAQAERAAQKALLYGERQVDGPGYAALLLAYGMVLADTGRGEMAAHLESQARALAPGVAAEAASLGAENWLERLTHGPARP